MGKYGTRKSVDHHVPIKIAIWRGISHFKTHHDTALSVFRVIQGFHDQAASIFCQVDSGDASFGALLNVGVVWCPEAVPRSGSGLQFFAVQDNAPRRLGVSRSIWCYTWRSSRITEKFPIEYGGSDL